MNANDDSAALGSTKQTVVRGARACTVCRAAKMKCVPSPDGDKQCQRCKRANVECIFEKHKRGRKPGSKLSEASKMLRRLEKGLNTAKLKSDEAMYPPGDPRGGDLSSSAYPGLRPGESSAYHLANARFDSSNHVHPHHHHHPHHHRPEDRYGQPPPSRDGSRSMTLDDTDDAGERADDGLYPAKLIRKENQRNSSFFRTILNPEGEGAVGSPGTPSSSPSHSANGSANGSNINHNANGPNTNDTSNGALYDRPPKRPRTDSHSANNPPSTDVPIRTSPSGQPIYDPISASLITQDDAKTLFDLLFLRLNPFINMFDPVLHTPAYVRAKDPLLFTTMIMAGCKFFKPEVFKACQRMANELAIRAFAEAWKSVEIAQAFACLTYWRDPDDNRTWTYIGYASRMAIELGLNHSSPPHPNEPELARLERRNRERTYLILFVHDRSLSTQTGRLWSMPEDAFTRGSGNWHKTAGGGSSVPRPEDVIVVAFVQLRRIASEVTETFNEMIGSGDAPSELNHDAILRNCNAKLREWEENWHHELERARGEPFHFSFIDFFQLYSKVFINSFGIRAAVAPASRATPSIEALYACYTSALEALKIASTAFPTMNMLRYGQDSILVMSAYCAVFLLKLLRSPNTVTRLPANIALDIRSMISKTADAYHEASMVSPGCTSPQYHARFLRSLVDNDVFQTGRMEPSVAASSSEGVYTMHIDPTLQETPPPATSQSPPLVNSGSGPNGHLGGGPGPNGGHHHQHPSQHPSYPSHTQQQYQNGAGFQFPASPHLPVFPLPYPPESAERGTAGGPNTNSTNGSHEFTYPQHVNSANAAVATKLEQQYWQNMFTEMGFGASQQQQQLQQRPQAPYQYQPHQLQYHPIQQDGYNNHGH